MSARALAKLPAYRESNFFRFGFAAHRSAVGGIYCCSFRQAKRNIFGQRGPAQNSSIGPLRNDPVYIHGDASMKSRKVISRHRILSGVASPIVNHPPSGKDATDDMSADGPPSSPVGLRPETAPASTPIDLGCKAYYMARTINIQTVRSRLYAGFPHRFEKHCVVIGPLDPNCFDGDYPRPRDNGEGLGGVIRELSKRKDNNGTGTGKLTGPQRRPFVTPPYFTMEGQEGQEYQPRPWEMWEPAGGPNAEKPARIVNGRMKDAGNSYVVIFNYGSVVFLHFNQSQQEEHLRRQRDFLYKEDKIMPADVKTETHGVALWSTLPEPARLEPDCTTLRDLDVNHITIIGTVLGQTVALDHYGDLVDSMMAKFSAINSGVEKTGMFSGSQKTELFQLVARNNTVRTDVISKLGILERSEAAWKHQDYNYVWEGLREEFEMDSRLKTLESKLSMLQQNTNFFIEMLHNQKSTMLEWTIIVLIGAEIVVGVCDLLNFKPFAK